MASNRSSKGSHGSDSRHDSDFWQQLDKDFPFHNVDEEALRHHTAQWMTCANELLGPVPSRSKQKAKR